MLYRVWYWTGYQKNKGQLLFEDYRWKDRQGVEHQVSEWEEELDAKHHPETLSYIEMIEEVSA